jgi:hypothetical protein
LFLTFRPRTLLFSNCLNGYFPSHVRDTAQHYTTSVPPPPTSNVVNQAVIAVENVMSDSDSSPAPTATDLSSPPVAAGLTTDIAEYLLFTERRSRLKCVNNVQRKLLTSQRSPLRSAKQRDILKCVHDVDVAKHHLVACAVNMTKPPIIAVPTLIQPLMYCSPLGFRSEPSCFLPTPLSILSLIC